MIQAPYDFVKRDRCPACERWDSETLFESGFERAGIGTFVRSYYKVNPNLLRKAAAPALRISGRSGTIDPTSLKTMAKKLIRPWHQYRDRRKLFTWLRKPI